MSFELVAAAPQREPAAFTATAGASRGRARALPPLCMAEAVQTEERLQVLEQYRAKVREHSEAEAALKKARLDVRDLVKEFNDTEDALRALQSVGQIIGDTLRQLDEDKFIVKARRRPSSAPRRAALLLLRLLDAPPPAALSLLSLLYTPTPPTAL